MENRWIISVEREKSVYTKEWGVKSRNNLIYFIYYKSWSVCILLYSTLKYMYLLYSQHVVIMLCDIIGSRSF